MFHRITIRTWAFSNLEWASNKAMINYGFLWPIVKDFKENNDEHIRIMLILAKAIKYESQIQIK